MARFVLLPAASLSLDSARHFQRELAVHGIREDQVEILEVLHSNASLSANDPSNVERIDRATAVYMTGGDQVRLVRALTNSDDGSDTPLLSAMRRLYLRGGVIAGTSAGASAQSAHMLAASGLPSMLVDEGLDALDFGLTTDSVARGILVTQGLGFLGQGIIDQHFLQYRGRLGRLSRVTLERKIPFGIGIDRDSAIRVDQNGKITVIGGTAVVVLADKANFRSSPIGFSLDNMLISLLSMGDVFDPTDSSIIIHSSKHPIVEEDVTFNGGFLITDIGSGYAVSTALIGGLANNTQSRQEGIVLQFHDATSHGYRYQFQKVPNTKAFHTDTLDGSLYSVLNVQLGITPIANGLFPSSTQSPIDLLDLPLTTRNAVAAVAFRGILPTNSRLEFRPSDFVSRREFAVACVRSVHLNAPPDNRRTIADLADENVIELRQAIEAGFVKLDNRNNLHPDLPISGCDLKAGLKRLSELSVQSPPNAFLIALDQLKEFDQPAISRSRFAVLLTQLLFPQWYEP
jgi:cyanophycinase